MNCVDISRALICSYTSRPSHPCSPIYNNITLGYLILPSQLLISSVTKLIELTENSVLHFLFSGHPLAGMYVNNIIICLSTSETKNYVPKNRTIYLRTRSQSITESQSLWSLQELKRKAMLEKRSVTSKSIFGAVLWTKYTRGTSLPFSSPFRPFFMFI